MVKICVENYERVVKSLLDGNWVGGWMDGWMGGWVGGRESGFKDCLQQSKRSKSDFNRNQAFIGNQL